MKPVASGCQVTPAGLVNDDALKLQAQASFTVPYQQVNPYAFERPIAPHLAAQAEGVQIETAAIERALDVLTQAADRVVVEGVGGWLVPISSTQTMADVARTLALPVVLVVGVRLGCINHALLTAAAIDSAGVVFDGWVANRLDPDCEAVDETVAALQERLAVPCLGELNYSPDDELPIEQFREFHL
jgi:dethiobiotin synthetase